MNYLKTFENYSINEEELFDKAKKFFTGYEDKESKETAKIDFLKSLAEAEELVSKNPKGYVFNKANLEEKAKENNYKGGLRIQRGGRNSSKVYILYDMGTSGFQKLASGRSLAR